MKTGMNFKCNKSSIRYLSRCLLAIFVPMFILWTPLHSQAGRYERLQQQFQEQAQSTMEATLKGLATDVMPVSKDLSKTLLQISDRVKDIQYTREQWMPNTKFACLKTDESIWIAEPGKRPVVSLNGTLYDTGEISAELLIHESISALGVVDDEYQVSGPLLALQSLKDEGRLNKAEIQALINGIKIEKHRATPTYKFKQTEALCYDDKMQLMESNTGGTATGIGGGGNSLYLGMKMLLTKGYQKWWKKNFRDQKMPESFVKAVFALGFEPLPAQVNVTLRFPLQMDFSFSKRTGKHVVRMLLTNLDSDTTTSDRTFDVLFRHLYDQTQKPKPFQYKHFIYGAELAQNLNFISEEKRWELFDQYEKGLKHPWPLARVIVN